MKAIELQMTIANLDELIELVKGPNLTFASKELLTFEYLSERYPIVSEQEKSIIKNNLPYLNLITQTSYVQQANMLFKTIADIKEL